MYTPRPFREERIDLLHETMLNIGAATIVGTGPEGLAATHVPIILDANPAPLGTLRCHFAKANPHAATIESLQEVMAIFQGPQANITPNWYPTKRLTAKVVPTWNYVAIHAYGIATAIDDATWLLNHLSELTGRFEINSAVPWKVDDAPPEYIDRMCKAIVGIEIKLTQIDGKWKLSQNRSEPDRQGVVAGLRAAGDGPSLTMADLVERAYSEA